MRCRGRVGVLVHFPELTLVVLVSTVGLLGMLKESWDSVKAQIAASVETQSACTARACVCVCVCVCGLQLRVVTPRSSLHRQS